MVSVRIKGMPLWAVVVFLLLFGGTVPAFSAGAGDKMPSAREREMEEGNIRSLAQVWEVRAGDLSALALEVEELQKKAEDMAAPLAGKVRNIQTQFARASSLFQASRGHPTEQMTLVQQMQGLSDRLAQATRPLENIAGTIAQRLGEIAALQADLDNLFTTGAAEGVNLKAEVEGLREYNRTLAAAKRKLTAASTKVESILAPARAVSERMTHVITDVDGLLISIWQHYYLTPAATDIDRLAEAPAVFAEWGGSLGGRMIFAWPQASGEWGHAARIFLVSGVVMAALGLAAWRGTDGFPERWRTACRRVIKRAWVWIGIGLSVLMASPNQQGGVYFALVLLGSLILIAGIASLSWRLRIAVLPRLAGEPSPLLQLYMPASLGVLMLFSDLPPSVLSIFWTVVTTLFLFHIFFFNRRRRACGDLPWLERFTYGSAFWVALVSLLVTVSGYARMAVLVFMLLFALVNTIMLCTALAALLSMLAGRVFSQKTQPISHALADALAAPVAGVLSLLCTVPWLWAIPGARYLGKNMAEANYTVGEASFDFFRLVLLVVLFFVFRAFVSLGRTTLSHLPERVPHIERGVIPSLRVVFTYGFWTLFVLIVLGVLGVNFTSLAVVAGGLSVGIGFGLQNIFNNLISGLMLIFERNILVGDYVEVGGAAGTVKSISIRSTTIQTPERALIYVPNSSIMSGQLTNWTRESRVVRRSIPIGVAYGSDVELVERVLLEAAAAQDHVLKMPEPVVVFSNFGASSIDLVLNIFIDDFDYSVSTASKVRLEIDRKFAEHGIEIPFPQMTLHTAGEGDAPALPEAGEGMEDGNEKESRGRAEKRRK